MITDLSFDEFCSKYYLDAQRIADWEIKAFIKKNGQPHSSLDMDLIKDKAIERSLRKAFDRYDFEKGRNASLRTFLSTIIHNQVLTELRNEGTAIQAGKRGSIDGTSGGEAFKDENDADGSQDNKSKMRSKVEECIKKLDPIEQAIINCWMDNQGNYRIAALAALGWSQERKDEVTALREQAFDKLQKMLKEFEPVHEKQEVSQSEKEPPTIGSSRMVYIYDVPLKAIEYYAVYIRKYFGLYHPNLDLDLELLKNDPDRTFKLYEVVLHDEIEVAFDEGGFTYEEGTRRGYLELLWLVANIYCFNYYQRYQDYYTYEVEYDSLLWETVKDDILKLYIFLQDHMAEAPITIKIGGKKVVISDYDGWFQALMNNHLFPKCLPEIHSKDQALKKLKKSPGRKVQNKLAVAIINGIATLFYDEGLVTERAPKNLCIFIRRYLVMMEILDLDYSVINEASIKSAINYASKKKTDPRLPSRPVTDATIEDLRLSGFIPEERWLFSKE